MIKVNQHLESKQVITSDLYKGSIIEKAYGGGDEGLISSEIIRKQLGNKLEKGIIDPLLYGIAIHQLDNLLEKASKGEGSKGGHIIGHTKSGKAVYKTGEKGEKYSGQDHLDAAEAHRQEAGKHIDEAGKSGYQARQSHITIADHHNRMIQSHEKSAHDITQKEHESGLSNDEKKILAEQKKKQIEHHDKMHKFYTSMEKHVKSAGNAHGVNFESDQEAKRYADTASHHKQEKERLEKN